MGEGTWWSQVSNALGTLSFLLINTIHPIQGYLQLVHHHTMVCICMEAWPIIAQPSLYLLFLQNPKLATYSSFPPMAELPKAHPS